jgi:hypothetical protein
MKKLQLIVIAIALLIGSQARASITFELTYNDGVNVANGQINADYVSPGVYQATSGFLDITAGALQGNYPLLPNPNAPSAAYSPSGVFIYDDVLYYPGDPYLNSNGLLLFAAGTREINLWGNGPGNYSLYGYDYNQGWILQYTGPADTGITPVPEPATTAAGAALLLAFGGSTLRYLRKKA